MKRRLAAAILTATVTAGAVTVPAAAEWEEPGAACVQTIGASQGNGWQLIGGTWYFLTENGYRQGWYREKGNWYFLDNRGAMVTGWAEIDGKAYCFGTDGVMLTGNAEKDGESYSLGIDGAVTGENLPQIEKIYVTISGIVRAVA